MPTKPQTASTTGDQTKDQKKDALLAQIAQVNEKRRTATTRRSAKAASNTTGEKKVATRSKKTDEEVGFLDDIPVHKADGTVTTLDTLEHPADKAPASNGKKATTRKPSAKAQVDAATKAKLQAESIKKKALSDAAAIRDKAKKDAAALKEKTSLATAKAREDAAAKKKADREAAAQKKKDDRAAAAEAKKVEREAKAAERAAAKLRAKGETGNAELDALFHQAVDSTKALAVVPTETQVGSLHFLSIPGVELTTVGLTLPEGFPITEWAGAIRDLRGMQDTTGFAIGDAIIYGEAEYGKQYDVVMAALDLAKSTVKNYKYVAGVFDQTERVVGVPFGHHLEVAGLKQSNPAKALNLLVQAGEERWTQAQLRQAVSEAKGGPTVAQKKQAEVEALVMLSNDQFEADLAELGSPAAIARFVQADVDAFLDFATHNDEVPAESALRTVARLKKQLDEALGEVQIWKEKAQALQAQVDRFTNVQAEVGADDVPTEPEDQEPTEEVTEEVEADEDDSLDDLDATETDDNEESES